MPLNLIDVIKWQYSTTRDADKRCDELLKKLGYKTRYLTARLAIARSLSVSEETPDLEINEEEDTATPIKGQQLFGDDDSPAAWVALLVQSSGKKDISKREFQELVASHWKRGAILLTSDWKDCGENLQTFVARLADFSYLPDKPIKSAADKGNSLMPALSTKVELPIGEISKDIESGESIFFPLNASGGSPHYALMGGAGSGKTRTAISMMKSLAAIGSVPLLAFDFKGDLADSLAPIYGAEILAPPRIPVPLDVFSISAQDETGIKEAASRIRESIARVKVTKISGTQSDMLRTASYNALKASQTGKSVSLEEILVHLKKEYRLQNKKNDELIATMNELVQFSLFSNNLTPLEFFSKSWIVKLPQDGPAEVRRLVINLMLDSLDRWINGLSDSAITDGYCRSLRHICLLDEANVILSTKLPALSNLIRMSRSKGGVVGLISQSPDDFEGAEDDFLDNMGLVLAFNTQAKPGPTRNIFANGKNLTALPVGEALCRIRTEASTRQIAVWK